MPSPTGRTPFSRKPGVCFDQILLVGSSQISLVRSRFPGAPIVGPEINFGNTGYSFPSQGDAYELEIHFVQPFTIKYIFVPNRGNVETFRVEASHAGMSAVFNAKSTNDGLVVDGFPPMLISMLVLSFSQTTDGKVPGDITLNIVRSMDN